MPTEETKLQNRRNALLCAAQLCEEFGVEKITLNAVAKKAGLTERSVINYFGSREELMKAVLCHMMAEMYLELDEVCESKAFHEKNGCEQLIGMIEYILSAHQGRYNAIQAITELEFMLARNGNLPKEYYSSPVNTTTMHIKNAMDKGAKDGSLRAELYENMNAAMVLTYSSRGVSRQMAFTYTRNRFMKCYDLDKLLKDYIQQVKLGYGITAESEQMKEV